ncbi:ash family protein, partial [Yersinia enterocolitica]|uniref:ash family protein n=1 Tax=Yersinia enterocolitica TaxID=630 RepID=UPI0021AE00FF
LRTYKNRLPNTITGRYISPAAAKSAAGFRSPETNEAHNRALSGFFMRKAQPHFRTMVGRAGALSGAPGSSLAGTANPARLTTLKSFAALGGELSQLTNKRLHHGKSQTAPRTRAASPPPNRNQP